MKEKEYSKEDFLSDLKKYDNQFDDDKESFNKLFHTHIIFLEYKSSTKKFEPTIICSNKPLIKFFLSGLGYKKDKIRVAINKLNLNETKITGKSKKISSFSLVYRKFQTIPIENIKIHKKILLTEDNFDEICKTLKGISKMWEYNNHLKRIFS